MMIDFSLLALQSSLVNEVVQHIPGVTIGNNNLIGAGAIVIKDVPDGVTVVGNKARILERK